MSYLDGVKSYILKGCYPQVRTDALNNNSEMFIKVICFIGEYSHFYIGNTGVKESFENGLKVIVALAKRNYDSNIKINCIKMLIGNKSQKLRKLAKKNERCLVRAQKRQEVFLDTDIVFRVILDTLNDMNSKTEVDPLYLDIQNNCLEMLNPSLLSSLLSIERNNNARKRSRILAGEIKEKLQKI